MGDAAVVPAAARSTSTSPAAPTPSCSTCRTSAPCASRARTPLERLQVAFTNDLAQDRPGSRPVHASARRGRRARCSTTSSCGGSTTRSFDVMPNASNTDRVRAAIGGTETTHDRAVLAVQGPTRRRALGDGVSRRRRGRSLPRRHGSTWEGIDCVVAGTGYTGEDGVEIAVPRRRAPDAVGRDPRRRRPPAGLGRARHAAARGRAAAARPRARPRHHAAAGRAGLGRGLGEGRVPWSSRAGAPSRPRGVAPPLDGDHHRRSPPPRADARCSSTIDAGRHRDQRQLLAGARPWHRPRVHAARHRGRAPRSSSTFAAQACRATSCRRPSSPSAEPRSALLGRCLLGAPSWSAGAFFAAAFFGRGLL